MSPHNNLHNSLKKALGDHPEPLREAQWERLQQALGNKPRRRLLPFFWIIIGICLVSGAAAWWLLSTGKPNGKYNSDNTIAADQHVTADQSATDKTKGSHILPETNATGNNNTDQSTESTEGQNNQNNNQQEHSTAVNSSNSNDITSNNIRHTKQTRSHSSDKKKNLQVPVGRKNPDRMFPDIGHEPYIGPDTKPKYVNRESANNDNQPANELNINKPVDKEPPSPLETTAPELANTGKAGDTTQTAAVAKSDSTKNPDTENHKNKPGTERKRFVISFSAGISPGMKNQITGISNENKQHKDTRSLYDQSNSNNNGYFGNLAFDWNILPSLNIGLNSGIQYRVMYTPVNVDYRLTEIPFYDIDGTIVGYVKDSTGIPITLNTTNRTTFVYIPFRFNYAIPLNKRNELVLTAGINCAMLAGTKGSRIRITNEAATEEIKPSMYNRVNIGLITGLQYARVIYDPWWLGVEVQMQQNTLRFDNGPGKVSSRLSGTNINLVLKYKF